METVFSLPLQSPATTMLALGMILLLIPSLTRFLRVPPIARFIIAGMLAGSYGLACWPVKVS